ncbi:hypothetical protein K402DRAFT_388597 [Aulographum hederae CBS 113979]|uniref:DUF7730 domain-containing protein n=1 Tax=Aulographum hederae CBS 113979 TaxID=1176131 RepID=A0A6G1HFT9_9PEZI|nr:hypothetical protein K402DRAFT_388597 [Aulographum hederae CBS 113979]
MTMKLRSHTAAERQSSAQQQQQQQQLQATKTIGTALGKRRRSDEESEPPHVPSLSPEQRSPIFLANPSPLLSLPAELRNHIYAFALERPSPILLHLRRQPKVSDDFDCGSIPADLATTIQRGGRRIASTTRGFSGRDIEFNCGAEINDYPLIPEILCLNKQIYSEARVILYRNNTFVLSPLSGQSTILSLHQQNRSLIRHIRIAIPSHHDILEGFSDLVRLGLRYCWGLKSLTIVLPESLPSERGGHAPGTGSVYANAFHILRWLPRPCEVKLEGTQHQAIVDVVEDIRRVGKDMDETAYQRRQIQMYETRASVQDSKPRFVLNSYQN